MITSMSTLRSFIFRDAPLSTMTLAMGASLGAINFCFLTDGGDCSSTHSNHSNPSKGNEALAGDGRMKQHFRWQTHHPARNTSCLCEGMKENRYQFESRQLFPPKTTLHTGVTNASNQNNVSTSRSKSIDLSNRILLMADMLSPEECLLLRNDADNLLDCRYDRDLMDDVDEDGNDDADADDDEESAAQERSLRRVSLCDMSQASQNLSHELIFERILPALRHKNPSLLENLGLFNFDALTNEMDWASDEPSINRYEIGGRFDPHRDGYALTVIVLLSTDGAFDGGGTIFFDSSQAAEASMDGNYGDDTNTKSSVVVKPPQGTAVLFSGDIYHAGRPVTNGTRHLFVASFSPKDTPATT